MSAQQPVSKSWEVNGLQLAGLCWGEPGGVPVLCLHGWLDNAASFSLLAPGLAACQVVALDLTGHGQSSHRSVDASYQIWDDLPEVLGVADALGWDQFNLIGHSRGAIISSLLASAQPQRIRRLVLLDGVSPEPVENAKFALQLGKFLQDKARLQHRQQRLFKRVDEAVQSRVDTGLVEPAARLLVQRNLRGCNGGFTWTTDPRLRGASAVKMTAGQIQAVLEGLMMPTLLLMAQEGFGSHPEILDKARRYIPDLRQETVNGGHHFHMEDGAFSVARRIVEFLQE